MEKHPLHLKQPDLQKSPEIQKSVEKYERLNSEKLPNDPTDRIETHMSRLEKIFLNPDEDTRNRNLEMLKPAIYDNFIIKREEVPESYFELQQRIARERGQQVDDIPQNVREQMINTIIEDQKQSLDQWIDYLTSEDAVYPTWFKYFVFQNITKLSQFDKSLGKFKKRTKDTTATYPDIFREPLAQICDIYEKVAADNNLLKTDPKIQLEFSKSFPKLYAEKISESLLAKLESNEQIKGEWIKYEQGNSNHAKKLYESLKGKGTGWCTAGDSTAKKQINSGDFYVYYTYNEHNEPTQPRLAIRMNGKDKIGEVRGISQHQEVEPIMQDALAEKLSDFGDESKIYEKKSVDMKKLTEIDNRTKENSSTQLSKDDLIFLYEVNSPIEGFGYQKDPRIAEILKNRNIVEDINVIYGFDINETNSTTLKFIYDVGETRTPSVFLESSEIKSILQSRNPIEDLPIVFDCTPDQIATNQSEVNENTKIYSGPLYPGISKDLPPTIEKIYTNFPEKISEVYIKEIEIPAKLKTAEEYKAELEKEGHQISDWAKDILPRANLVEGSGEKIRLFIVSNKSLGFTSDATRAESKTRAQQFGFGNETLPAVISLELRKQYTNQPNGEYILIDMESAIGRDGFPRVFLVARIDSGSLLDADDGGPGRRWFDCNRWAFSQI